MNINQPNQPRKDDAVLGGKNPPINAAVLGGIQGVKARLNPANPIEVKIAALKNALNYGEAGLEIVIQALQKNPLIGMKVAAYQLLKEREETKIQWFLSHFPDFFDFDVITVNREGLEISRKKHSAYFFKEDIGNGVTLDMVYIPGGTFLMGAPETEAQSNDKEKPQHQVTIQPFYMGKYVVTQAQWNAIAKLPKIKYDLSSGRKGDNHPIELVSWREAVEFCARLSQKTGRNYRLPSEAEWEYACRAGTTTAYCFGETVTDELASIPSTTDVGKYPPNAFGLYDMLGNIGEWCADPWHDSYNGAPTDGSVWDEEYNDNRYQNSADLLIMSENDNRSRLVRGGSWSWPWDCRSVVRLYGVWCVSSSDIGFRFVCAAE